MTRRSLGELTVNIVAADASFVQGMDRVERKSERTARQVASAQKRAAAESEAAWKKATESMGAGGISDRQYNAAMRGLSAQFTDIAVSLQGGQNPLTVLFQQGGQIKDMFGGIGPALKAVTSGIVGMINPVTVLGAAVAAMGYGWYAGAQESQKFLVALETTGYQAGTTVGQLNDMAASMGRLDGVTRGKAAEALALFATSAGVGSDRLERYTSTALAWEKATGESADKVAEKFKKIAEDPVKGILEVNKQMGFLTAATFSQVKALQEAGRVTDAARVASDAYDAALANASTNILQNLGYLERGWNAVSSATFKAIDSVKKFGREQGNASQLTDTLTRINDLQSKGVKLVNSAAEASSYAERDLFNLKQREIQLQKNIVAETNSSKAKEATRQQEQTLIDLSQEATKYADKRTQRTQALAAAEQKYGAAAKTNAEAAKQYAAVIAGINERYKDPKVAKTPKSDTEKQLDREIKAADQFMKMVEKRALKTEDLTEYEKLMNEMQISGINLSDEQLGKLQAIGIRLDMAKDAERSRGDELFRNNTLFEAQEKLLAKTAEYEAEIAAYGQGDKTNARLRERISLIQSQQTELRKMERDQANALAGAKTDADMEQLRARYEDRLAITKEYQQKELDEFDKTQAKKRELDGNWLLGAQASIQTYIEKTQDSYAQARDATTSMMTTIEGAFVNLFTLGESSFKNFTATILKGIAQIAAQQAASGIAGFFGSAISSLLTGGVGAMGAGTSASSILNTGIGFGGFRAAGGPVAGGSLYRVNELGPELLSYGGSDYLMMGGSGGYVKPLGAATTEQRGAGNITVVNQTTGRVDKVEQRQLTPEDVVLIIQEQTPKVMVSQTQNANSPFSRTMQGSFNTSRRR